MHPVGMPPGPGAWVFPVGAEGVAPLVCARYKFCDPMLVEVVASPLSFSWQVSWVIPDTGKLSWCVQVRRVFN